ncbi:WD40/YVTN/BNR-like repeat-containing protein [Ideonella margarita]|uniref:YCF48-related protein n=1 Tax=Ideonella margarita TaxID=2984191 RepID=A0ABU9C4U2_9BURK
MSLHHTGVSRRQLLATAPAWLAGHALAAAPAEMPTALPLVLQQPAVASAKAQGLTMLAVARAGQRLVAAGERGTVLLSDDHGQTWRQARVPVQVSITALCFVDERTGWAAGHLGALLKTQDAGETWVLQFDGQRAAAAIAGAWQDGTEAERRKARRWLAEGPDKAFFDLCFTDARHGVAVGAYGMAFSTADGGESWQALTPALPNPGSQHLYAVRVVQGRLMLAGEQGLLIRADDTGRRFELLPPPSKGTLFGLVALPSGTLLVHGLRGQLLRSTDQGAHWQKIDTGTTATLSAGLPLADGRVLLLAQTGELLLGLDDGRQVKPLPGRAGVPAAALGAAADGHLLVASLRGMRRLPAP